MKQSMYCNTRLGLVAVLLCSMSFALMSAAEDLPTPGNVHLRDGTVQEGVYIIREGLDESIWSRDDRGQARTSREANAIARIEYTPVPRSERGYSRGMGALRNNNWSGASEAFAETSSGSRFAYYRIDAHLRRAEALKNLKRYDEALAEAKTVVEKYGSWVYVVRAQELQAEINEAADKLDAARQSYRRLREAASGYGGYWSSHAIATGALGEARLLLAAGKVGDAIQLLAQARSKVSLEDAPTQHGALAAALGKAYLEDGKNAKAREIFAAIRYAPIDPTHRSQAFLQLGKMHLDAEEHQDAVDALVTAAILRGGDDAARAEARRLARTLLGEMGRDEDIDPVLRAEYRSYASSL